MRDHLYRLSGGALIGSFVLSLAGGMAAPAAASAPKSLVAV
jgi:hypothetical protein